MIIGTTTCVM